MRARRCAVGALRLGLRSYALAALFLALGCRAPSPARPEPGASIALYRPLELTFSRPLDAVRFTGPDGKTLTVPAFPTHGEWHVRFAARRTGRWRWAGGGRAGQFTVISGPGHGDVVRDPRVAHQLILADGTPFLPLGENRFNVYDPTWNYRQQSIEQYLAAMAAAGENTLRIFVICDCEDESRHDKVQLGCLETAPGRFDDEAALRYDRIINAAERDGIYVIFGVWAIGFSLEGDEWKGWVDNPYRALGTRDQFFIDESIRRVAATKLRYIAARWGWSTHLLAVDLLNEPEWDGRIPESVWIPWAEKMAHSWRAVDPYGHLVTAGPVGLQYNLGGDERPFYAFPGNDIVQWHLYGKEFYEPHALATEMSRKVEEVWPFGKPVLVGEFAYGGEDKETYDHTHVGIWSATFSGAGVLMHSAPPFNLDSDEPMTPARAHHVRVLAEFLASLPKTALTPSKVEVDHGVRGWALRGRDVVAVWLLGPRDGYGQPVRDVHLTIDGLSGRWQVRFVDDVTGRVLGEEKLEASTDLTTTLDVVPFVRHLAVRLSRI